MSDIPRMDRLAPEQRENIRRLFAALDWNRQRAEQNDQFGNASEARRHRNNVAALYAKIKAIMMQDEDQLNEKR
jgi:hypothetical protein